jgi:EmrB/QacA subfamily drug resistance transporter
MTSSSTPDSSAGQVAINSRPGRVLIVTTVMGSSVAMLTATVVNVALPTLAVDLDASSSAQQWVVNGYLLTLASLILIGGSLGDRFGRVRIYRLGVAWFAVASLLCAVAPNVELLIAARLLQGVGGALLTPGSLAIIEATLRPDDRGRGVGLWAALIGITGAIGPLVGGLLVDLSWRWVFVINIPVAILVLILSTRLPESIDPDSSDSPIDFVGAALTVVMLGGLSYALIEGPSSGLRLDSVVAAVLAAIALVGLIRYEPTRPQAMVPVDLFANREFVAANLITFLVYGGMGVVFFLMSIQLQVTSGFSPLMAGASFLPMTFLMLLLSARAGDLSQRIGPRLPLTIGATLIALGMLLFTRIGPEADYVVDVLPGVLVYGLGLAAVVAPVTATAMGTVPESRSGAASGTNNAVSRTGQLLAVAAIPPLVGLTNDALRDPVQLDRGYSMAMVVGAGLVAVGGGVAWWMLRPEAETVPSPAPPVRQYTYCALDGHYPQPTVPVSTPGGR